MTKLDRWAEAARAATLEHSLAGPRDGLKTFRGLTARHQMALAREIVVTRQKELSLAYADIVSVGWGYRRTSNKNSGKQRLVREACVTFVVKRKARGGAKLSAQRALPRHLQIYATVKGARVLCSVPTDVEDGAKYARIIPHAGVPGISATSPSALSITGNIACVIKRPACGAQRFGIGCRHVLSMTDTLRDKTWGLQIVSNASAGNFVGTTISVAGAIRRMGMSFDAQLMKISDRDSLDIAMGSLKFQGFANEGDIPHPYSDYYVIGTNGIASLSFSQMLPSLTYDFPIFGQTATATFADLVESKVKFGTPDIGDSGSPVMTRQDGGVLLGMHIASTEDCTRAYMIPAWNLLKPERYGSNEVNWALG